MDLHLARQTAVITGGSSGIGFATARIFLEEGARVAIWDRTPLPTGDAFFEAARQRDQLIECQADVTSPEQLETARETTLGHFGRIDHLVHAAAVGSGKYGFPFTHLSPQDWKRVLEVNIMGTTHVAHCVAPLMMAQRSGTIALVGSIAGQIGSQTDPPYSASKAANINFAQCLAKDLAGYSVRVNIVNPGMIQTPLNRSVWQAWRDQDPASHQQRYEEWAEEKIRRIIPLGRWQTPEDIAHLIVFLASPRAANITGQSLNVDGGCVIRG